MTTRGFHFRLSLLLVSLGIAESTQACFVFVPRNPADIRYADVVVIGRVKNYRIVLDQRAREERRKMLAQNTKMSAAMRKLLQNQDGFMSDYAQFDVVVDKTIKGMPQKVITVKWDNSTFGEPAAMAPGPYLIALRRPMSATPPLRGPSATILPLPRQTAFTPVQAPCSSPFILGEKADQDDAMRHLAGLKSFVEHKQPGGR